MWRPIVLSLSSGGFHGIGHIHFIFSAPLQNTHTRNPSYLTFLLVTLFNFDATLDSGFRFHRLSSLSTLVKNSAIPFCRKDACQVVADQHSKWVDLKVRSSMLGKARTMVSFRVMTLSSSLLSDTPCVNSQLNKVITDPVCECQSVADSLTWAGKSRKPKPVLERCSTSHRSSQWHAASPSYTPLLASTSYILNSITSHSNLYWVGLGWAGHTFIYSFIKPHRDQ